VTASLNGVFSGTTFAIKATMAEQSITLSSAICGIPSTICGALLFVWRFCLKTAAYLRFSCSLKRFFCSYKNLVLSERQTGNLVQGGPRLREWRAALRFEEKLAGRKERNSIAIERLVCCSNRPNFFCTPIAIFYSRVIFKFSVCLFANQKSTFANYEHGVEHIFSAKSLKRGQLPGLPSPWLRAWLPFSYFKMLP